LKLLGTIAALSLFSACASAPPPRPGGAITYIGSSTVGSFLREAEPVYGAVQLTLDTDPESDGGERAILAGETDLAGIARLPQPSTLRSGVVATFLGRDAIAVVVNARNTVRGLSMDQLRDVFAGRVESWRELGGPDLPVAAFIVGPESATLEVFRSAVLGSEPYAGCTEVRPDRDILAAVARTPGGIGQISLSFLEGMRELRALSIEGQAPTITNLDYPISRPLYLLWREGSPIVEAFVDWTQGSEGQRVLTQRFVGRRVVGSARGQAAALPTGTLIVYTETYPYYDGGIYYYPHRAYEIRTREGALVRRVPNRRGDNDETPMRVELAPGTYIVRADTDRGEAPEFFVTIDAGLSTELDVPALLEPPR